MAAVVPGLVFASSVAFFGYQTDLVGELSGFTLCPFRLVADWTCPGCGMLRAIIRLGQLEFTEAWSYHPFSYPVVAVTTVFTFFGQVPFKNGHSMSGFLALVGLILLWIYRSIVTCS